jgi:thymidylate synthase (FAD)
MEKLHTIKVLDKGFVKYVDHMGSDQSIEAAARQSYGEGTRSVRDTEKLIRYLVRHKHSSPIEMGEVVFQIKCPIFVARQWVRHRMHSMNEYSARYSRIMDDFYVPEERRVKLQSVTNKQGSADQLAETDVREAFLNRTRGVAQQTVQDYNTFESNGVSRELARINVPVNNYTLFTWKQDLRNLLHLLSLRMDSHAQWEIQQYANAMAMVVKELFPITYQAFEDYNLNAVTFSHKEFLWLKCYGLPKPEDKDHIMTSTGFEGREADEFIAKFN